MVHGGQVKQRRAMSVESENSSQISRRSSSIDSRSSNDMPSMKNVIASFGHDALKEFYNENKHGALGDAKSLARLTLQPCFHEDFVVFCFKKQAEMRNSLMYVAA